MRKSQVYIIEVCEKVLSACSLDPTLCACPFIMRIIQLPKSPQKRKKEKLVVCTKEIDHCSLAAVNDCLDEIVSCNASEPSP